MSDIFIEYAIHLLKNQDANIAEGVHASICDEFRNCANENDKILAYNNWRNKYKLLFPHDSGAIDAFIDDTIDSLNSN